MKNMTHVLPRAARRVYRPYPWALSRSAMAQRGYGMAAPAGDRHTGHCRRGCCLDQRLGATLQKGNRHDRSDVPKTANPCATSG